MLLESFEEITKLRMDQVLETVKSATDNCLFLLDRINSYEPCEQIYALVNPLPVARLESEPLSILLTKKEDTLTTKCKTPICVAPLTLQRKDVYKFLHEDFSDSNIDTFFDTMKSRVL